MRLSALLSAFALSAGVCTMSTAQVTGKVTLEGKVPDMAEITGIKNNPDCAKSHKDPVYEETVVAGDKGELANVVVSLKPADGKQLDAPPPTEPAVLDQKGCVYVPHVLAVMVGQPISIKNSDQCLHNVDAVAVEDGNSSFNRAQPPGPRPMKIEPYKKAENIKYKCDVHPWMTAWIRVLDNPYFAVTNEDGKFSIDTKGLPDGQYTLVAWQEKYGEQTKPVQVKDGKADLDLKFKAEEK